MERRVEVHFSWVDQGYYRNFVSKVREGPPYNELILFSIKDKNLALKSISLGYIFSPFVVPENIWTLSLNFLVYAVVRSIKPYGVMVESAWKKHTNCKILNMVQIYNSYASLEF